VAEKRIIPTSAEVREAFKAVLGKSETQIQAEDNAQQQTKFYTYDDLPAPDDGEVNPETGVKAIKRIPKHTIPQWEKAVVAIVVILFVGISVYLGFTNFKAIETTYEQMDDGGWQLKYFSGASTQTELWLDYVREDAGKKYGGEPILEQPLSAVDEFCAANAGYIQHIYIGESLTSVGRWAFNNSPKVTDITVDPANAFYCDVDGVLFSKDKKTLILYPMGKTAESYTIPEGVEVICSAAFYSDYQIEDNVHLKEIIFPSTLQTIEEMGFFGQRKLVQLNFNDGLRSIGKDAFGRCMGLEAQIYIPAGVDSIGDYAFYACLDVKTFYLARPEGDTELKLGYNWLPRFSPAMFKFSYSDVVYDVTPEAFNLAREGAKNG
jgi:hypothetical protein